MSVEPIHVVNWIALGSSAVVGAVVGAFIGGVLLLMLARKQGKPVGTDFTDIYGYWLDLGSESWNEQASMRTLGIIGGALLGAVVAGVVGYYYIGLAYIVGAVALVFLAGRTLYLLYRDCGYWSGYWLPLTDQVAKLNPGRNEMSAS